MTADKQPPSRRLTMLDRPKPRVALIVEDTEADQMILTRSIRKVWPSCTIVPAWDGPEALAHLIDMEPRGLPDVVFLDLNLPRVSGIELLDIHYGDGTRDAPVVVVLTSSKAESDRMAAQAHPVVKAYLVKPVTRQALRDLSGVLWGPGA